MGAIVARPTWRGTLGDMAFALATSQLAMQKG
jgi:hypothetical protein